MLDLPMSFIDSSTIPNPYEIPDAPWIVESSDAGGLAADVMQVQSTSADGYSSVGFLDDGGSRQLTIGYGNASAASPYTATSYIDYATSYLQVFGASVEVWRWSAATGSVGTVNGIATAQTPGLTIINSTAALVGAQTQYSPMFVLAGYAWKTTATAASQKVEFAFQNQAVASTTYAVGSLVVYYRVNSDTWYENLRLGGTYRRGASTSTGSLLALPGQHYSDSASIVGGTASLYTAVSIAIPTLYAENTTVTTTNAVTFYVAGGPKASTNQTLTNTHAAYIAAGAVGAATASYGLTVNAQTGSTTNYCAAFLGGRVGVGTATPAGRLDVTQAAATTTGGAPVLQLVGGAHTALTASSEVKDVYLNLARTVQFATGALTTQRAVHIEGATYAFVGASTITTAVTLEVDPPAAGTNATITNSWAVRSGGNVALSGATPTLAATAANAGLVFKGNRDAADTGYDVILQPTATRTDGGVVQIQRNAGGTTAYEGLTLTNTTAAITGTAVQAPPTLTFEGTALDTDAGGGDPNDSRKVQVRLRPGLTSATTVYGELSLDRRAETAPGSWDTWIEYYKFGSTLYIYSGGLSVAGSASIGYYAYFTGTAPLIAATTTADQGLTIRGNRAAASATYDVILQPTATRTAGGIVQIQNTTTTLAAVGYAGQMVHTPQAASGTPSATVGSLSSWATSTFTDSATAGSGTAAGFAAHSIAAPTLAATNLTVTTTEAATLYVSGPPIAGTNQTITRGSNLWLERAGLAAVAAPALVLANSTDSLVGVPVQVSPSVVWHSEVWDTAPGSNVVHEWQAYVLPESDTTTRSNLYFESRENAGAWAVRFFVRSDGYAQSTYFYAGGYVASPTMKTIATDGTLTIQGNRAAGTASAADILLQSTAVRTAGSILYVANTTTNLLDVTFRGQLLMTPQAWTSTLGTSTTGQLANTAAVTHTIDDGAGTYATWYGTALQAPTIAGAGADRIITNAATLFVAAPIASTLTITNALSAVFATSIKLTTGYIEQAEMTAPSAPGANGVRIFAQDNGAGKTQLMAIFASGAAQQIAIEP